ncbi:MAG TPA: Holliday junction branch migration protein RuvA [Thermomicrobiales bacterium]|nr:Holliday junction branch migration protein RuvA [Thermomicrobiales bacterium]
MIAGLRGTVARLEPGAVILDVNGVLYRVHVPASMTQGGGLETGQRLDLETHMVVREDSMTLYGFESVSDVEWFRVLIGLNGVGPKVALALMSKFSADEMAGIVHREDVMLLSTVPGLGKKTASRILLDLRGKIPEPTGTPLTGQVRMQDDDLIEALEGLGYSRVEAVGAASRVDLSPDATLEDRLLSALRQLTPSG